MDRRSNGNVNATVHPFMTYGGTANEIQSGLSIGLMDIGDNEDAYLFRVSLPGLRKNECNLKCEIKRDGTVNVSGEIQPDRGGESLSGYRVEQLSSPGPFTLSFQLPGPVDPRLFAPRFTADGVLEGVVMKFRA